VDRVDGLTADRYLQSIENNVRESGTWSQSKPLQCLSQTRSLQQLYGGNLEFAEWTFHHGLIGLFIKVCVERFYHNCLSCASRLLGNKETVESSS